MKIWICILTVAPLWSIAQVDDLRLVDSLKYVTDIPYMCESEKPYAVGCGSEIFWKVVQRKEAIIPLLIDRLADSTTTQAYVPNFGGRYTVADVAYCALEEIIVGIPTFKLLGVKFDTHGCGYCSYWGHLRKDIKNRKKFQAAVRNWYAKNKSQLVWIPSGQPFTGHHNGGMFHLKR